MLTSATSGCVDTKVCVQTAECNRRWNQQCGAAHTLQINHNILLDAPSVTTLGWWISAAAAVWGLRNGPSPLQHVSQEKNSKTKEFQGPSVTLRRQSWYPSKPGYLIQEKLVGVQGHLQSFGVASIIAGCLVNIEHLAGSSSQTQHSSAPPTPLSENLFINYIYYYYLWIYFLTFKETCNNWEKVKWLIISKVQSKGAA